MNSSNVFDDYVTLDFTLLFKFKETLEKFILSPDKLSTNQDETYAYLIDTSGNVRYAYQSSDDITKLVEHAAITIPKRPEKDIVLKNR